MVYALSNDAEDTRACIAAKGLDERQESPSKNLSAHRPRGSTNRHSARATHRVGQRIAVRIELIQPYAGLQEEAQALWPVVRVACDSACFDRLVNGVHELHHTAEFCSRDCRQSLRSPMVGDISVYVQTNMRGKATRKR